MGANVAVALSRLEVPVAFIGRIGNDQAGRLLLENLRRNKVEISSVKIERQSSLQTLILFGSERQRWIMALGLPNSALSISSPDEVNWDLVKACKIVYIGEVFVEVASAIASFAKNSGKTVVYRPGVPYLKLGIEKIRDVLEHTDIFIMNKLGWEALKKNSGGKLVEIADLQKFGPKTVILTKSGEGCEVWVEGKHFAYSLPKSLARKFKVVDPTGAGDSFSAALIKKLLDGSGLEEAIRFAQVAACITCSRVGASPAFPTLKEIMESFG
jgi:ribokinase